jgi:hypothetical protein
MDIKEKVGETLVMVSMFSFQFWGLTGVVLYFWTVLFARQMAGADAATFALLFPGVSTIYWLWRTWGDFVGFHYMALLCSIFFFAAVALYWIGHFLGGD